MFMWALIHNYDSPFYGPTINNVENQYPTTSLRLAAHTGCLKST